MAGSAFPTQTPLNLVMPVKPGAAPLLRALLTGVGARADRPVERALIGLGNVHHAQFVFLENDTHDAIFSPNTQSPDPDTAQGPFHTWVATAGSWRYDDDPGNGPDSPFKTIQNAHADETISSICISVGFTAGTNLSSLLRTWEVNTKDYAFGQ